MSAKRQSSLTLFFMADELPGIFLLYLLILCLSSSISPAMYAASLCVLLLSARPPADGAATTTQMNVHYGGRNLICASN